MPLLCLLAREWLLDSIIFCYEMTRISSFLLWIDKHFVHKAVGFSNRQEGRTHRSSEAAQTPRPGDHVRQVGARRASVRATLRPPITPGLASEAELVPRPGASTYEQVKEPRKPVRLGPATARGASCGLHEILFTGTCAIQCHLHSACHDVLPHKV